MRPWSEQYMHRTNESNSGNAKGIRDLSYFEGNLFLQNSPWKKNAEHPGITSKQVLVSATPARVYFEWNVLQFIPVVLNLV